MKGIVLKQPFRHLKTILCFSYITSVSTRKHLSEYIVLISVSTRKHFSKCAHLYSQVHVNKFVLTHTFLETSAEVCTDYS